MGINDKQCERTTIPTKKTKSPVDRSTGLYYTYYLNLNLNKSLYSFFIS